MNARKGACVFAIDKKEKKILAVKRRRNPNVVCFPGGKVDEGETFFEAAVRELLEETGYSTDLSNYTLISKGVFHNTEDNHEYHDEVYLVDYNHLKKTDYEVEDFTQPHLLSLEDFMKTNFNQAYYTMLFEKEDVKKIMKDFGLI